MPIVVGLAETTVTTGAVATVKVNAVAQPLLLPSWCSLERTRQQ